MKMQTKLGRSKEKRLIYHIFAVKQNSYKQMDSKQFTEEQKRITGKLVKAFNENDVKLDLTKENVLKALHDFSKCIEEELREKALKGQTY